MNKEKNNQSNYNIVAQEDALNKKFDI